jgi:hypothetical protein
VAKGANNVPETLMIDGLIVGDPHRWLSI